MSVKKKKPVTKQIVKKSPTKKSVKKSPKKAPKKDKKPTTLSFYGKIQPYDVQTATHFDVEMSDVVDRLKRELLEKSKLYYFMNKKKLVIQKARGKYECYKNTTINKLSKKDKEIIKTLISLEKLTK
jgi:hypothetical protein